MELDNIAYDELEPFLNSIPEERFTLPLALYLKAEFLTGVRIDGELAGIGGLVPAYRFSHFPIYTVKPEFRGKGIGTQLAEKVINYARRKGYSFFLTVVEKENEPSLIILKQQGYKMVRETDREYDMALLLNKRGEIIYKFLPLILRCFFDPLGKVLSFIRAHWPRFLVRGHRS